MRNLIFNLIVISVFGCFFHANSATCTATTNGNWSNPAIWSCGNVPGCGDIIVVPVGITVTVNVQVNLEGCSVLTNIQVSGTLQFVTGNKISLPCGSTLEVMFGGAMLPGGGGGSSSWLQICNVTEWQTSDGPAIGYKFYGLPILLPVGLVEFLVENKTKYFDFSWNVSSEQDNDYFTVDYSLNGSSWEPLFQVSSIGNHALGYIYNAIKNMENINSSLIYFKLKQTDINGETNVLAIKTCEIPSIEISVFPNPVLVGEDFIVSLNSTITQNSSIIFYDALGQLVYQELIQLKAGINLFNLKSLNFNSGIYLFTIPMVIGNEFHKIVLK